MPPLTEFAPRGNGFLQEFLRRTHGCLVEVDLSQRSAAEIVECPSCPPAVTNVAVQSEAPFKVRACSIELELGPCHHAENSQAPRNATSVVDPIAQRERFGQEAPRSPVAAIVVAHPAQMDEHPGGPTHMPMLTIEW